MLTLDNKAHHVNISTVSINTSVERDVFQLEKNLSKSNLPVEPLTEIPQNAEFCARAPRSPSAPRGGSDQPYTVKGETR